MAEDAAICRVVRGPAESRAGDAEAWQVGVVSVPLRIERNPAGGDHGDLLLAVAACRHRCDSYYFAIDESPTAPPDVDAALARLLDQWLADLALIRSGNGTAYLPFDLSDQCSAWLRVEPVEGDRFSVELGWTYVEGWSFVPSNYGNAASRIGPFDPIAGAHFVAKLKDLMVAIEEIRDRFKSSAGSS